MLSEENIQEDEFNDLIPLFEKGLLKRVTVMEFEEKVAAVHKDIVNHWIDKELKRLEKEIYIANEKGRHKEIVELMSRKTLLSTPAERKRLLEVIPEIDADAEVEKETKLKIAADNSCLVNRDGSKTRADYIDKSEGNHTKSNKDSKKYQLMWLLTWTVVMRRMFMAQVNGPGQTMHPLRVVNGGDLHREQLEWASGAALHTQGATAMWHYEDPHGNTQGPFELTKLWEWKRGGYFDENFKVWKTGNTKEDAILLADAFRMNL